MSQAGKDKHYIRLNTRYVLHKKLFLLGHFTPSLLITPQLFKRSSVLCFFVKTEFQLDNGSNIWPTKWSQIKLCPGWSCSSSGPPQEKALFSGAFASRAPNTSESSGRSGCPAQSSRSKRHTAWALSPPAASAAWVPTSALASPDRALQLMLTFLPSTKGFFDDKCR